MSLPIGKEWGRRGSRPYRAALVIAWLSAFFNADAQELKLPAYTNRFVTNWSQKALAAAQAGPEQLGTTTAVLRAGTSRAPGFGFGAALRAKAAAALAGRHQAAVIAKDSGLPAAPKVASRSVTLAWDPSPDTNAIWYRLYWGGASRSYTNQVQVPVGTTTATVSNLDNGGTYYFAATVGVVVPGNGNWLESDYSAEVSYTFPWQPVGITVVTVQPQMSMDQGANWTDIGPPWLTTNPASPVVLFKLRTRTDSY